MFDILVFFFENLIELTLSTTKKRNPKANFRTVMFNHLDQSTDLENTLVMLGIPTMC